MIKYQILILMLLGLCQLLHLLILLVEFMMYLLFNVLKFYKGISHKLVKHYLIRKGQKYYRLDLIELRKYGMQKLEMYYKFQKGIKIKYFHVNLIIKVILLLQEVKIILVRYGEMYILMEKLEIKKFKLRPTQLQLRKLVPNLVRRNHRKMMMIIDY